MTARLGAPCHLVRSFHLAGRSPARAHPIATMVLAVISTPPVGQWSTALGAEERRSLQGVVGGQDFPGDLGASGLGDLFQFVGWES